MAEAVLILCVLIWFPIILYQLSHRGFFVLIVWLLVAPVATNVIKRDTNPLFTTPQAFSEVREAQVGRVGGAGYATAPTTIRLQEVLEPTRILLSVLFAVFFLNALLKRTRLVPLDTTEIWMAIFSIILVVNVLLLSRRTAFGLRTALDAFMIPFLAYYVIRRYVTSEERFRQLTQILAYLGLYIITICLVERLLHGELFYRLRGPLGGAVQLFLVLTVIFYAILSGYQTCHRVLQRFLLYLIPIVILLTWSRGYWIGFLAGLGTFLFLGRRLISYPRKVGTIGVMLILLSMLAFGGLAVKEIIEERVANIRTVEWRLAKWDIALEEGLKQPIFGIGLNNLRDVYGELMGGYTTAHNSFLSLFAEVGAVGLFAYIAIVLSIIWTGLHLYWTGARSWDRWRGIAVISVIIAYQTAAATITLLYTVELSQVYIYVFVGAIAGLYARQPSNADLGMFARNRQPMSRKMSLPHDREQRISHEFHA